MQMIRSLDAGGSSYAAEAEAATQIEQELAALNGMLTEFHAIDPSILVSPFRSKTLSVTEVELEATDFFVPAVIALLMQHIAITLASLSIVQERERGAMELFRAGPISALEILIGKYLSFFLLMGFLAAVLTALVVGGLQAPMLGSWANYIVVLVVLVFASLSLGFVISLSSKSTAMAVQIAMIVLLGAIFFSGLFLALYRIQFPVQAISWLLPATYGTVMLQSVMLRGVGPSILLLAGLIAIGVLSFLIAWLRLRRKTGLV
jgi:ABC-2 type transport system permease protein